MNNIDPIADIINKVQKKSHNKVIKMKDVFHNYKNKKHTKIVIQNPYITTSPKSYMKNHKLQQLRKTMK